MDTSERYIKMRVAAIPDLGMGDGSFALSSPYFVTDNVWIAPNGNFYCHHNLGKEDVVIGCQLERQDQLQEMIDNRGFNTLLIYFPEFANTVANRPFTSMEQLWLAFVMKEKYGKVWDGSDWVKQP